jgi:hypothetical protein
MSTKTAAIKIHWEKLKDDYLCKTTLEKNGAPLATVPRAAEGQELYSPDGKYVYLLGGGVTHFNGVWQINLDSGEVKIHQPQYLTGIELSKDGVIAVWAEGKFPIKANEFEDPEQLRAKVQAEIKEKTRGTTLKSGQEKDFKLSTSYNQFFIVLDDYTDLDEQSDAASARNGFAVMEKNLILVRTEGQFNAYPLKFSYEKKCESKNKPSYTAEFEIDLKDGMVHVLVLFPDSDEIHLKVKKGKYMLRVSCFNAGEDPSEKMLNLSNSKFSKLADIERYVVELLERK